MRIVGTVAIALLLATTACNSGSGPSAATSPSPSQISAPSESPTATSSSTPPVSQTPTPSTTTTAQPAGDPYSCRRLTKALAENVLGTGVVKDGGSVPKKDSACSYHSTVHGDAYVAFYIERPGGTPTLHAPSWLLKHCSSSDQTVSHQRSVAPDAFLCRLRSGTSLEQDALAWTSGADEVLLTINDDFSTLPDNVAVETALQLR